MLLLYIVGNKPSPLQNTSSEHLLSDHFPPLAFNKIFLYGCYNYQYINPKDYHYLLFIGENMESIPMFSIWSSLSSNIEICDSFEECKFICTIKDMFLYSEWKEIIQKILLLHPNFSVEFYSSNPSQTQLFNIQLPINLKLPNYNSIISNIGIKAKSNNDSYVGVFVCGNERKLNRIQDICEDYNYDLDVQYDLNLDTFTF